jgi:tetratricopeptide (TPR) repeat protein
MILTITTWCIPTNLFSKATQEDQNSVTVAINGKINQYFLPEELLDLPHYIIKIPRSEFSLGVKGQDRIWKNNFSELELDQMASQNLARVEELIKVAKEHFHQGKLSQALQLLSDASKISPSNYVVKTMMGSIYFKLGNKSMASKNWNESLYLNPLQPKVSRYLEHLGQKKKKGKTLETKAKMMKRKNRNRKNKRRRKRKS